MNEREQFLLEDLRENGPQASWDWEADERFARAINDMEAHEIIHQACYGYAIELVQWNAMHTPLPKRVNKARLRSLRSLVQKGYCTATWGGVGEGMKSEYGISRNRIYDLK